MRIAWSVDPASVGYLADLGRDRARSLLGGASIGFPNADEARWLAGLSHDADVESSACALTEIWGTVVVKCGSDGAVVARQGSIVQRAAAEKCSVVDAVGAGDAFAGAWLSTRLGGGPETECLDAALGAASAAIGIVGGRPHPPE